MAELARGFSVGILLVLWVSACDADAPPNEESMPTADDTGQPGRSGDDAGEGANVGEPSEVAVPDAGSGQLTVGQDAGALPGQVDGHYTTDCAGLALKLRRCDLLTEGDYSCEEPASESAECELTCHLIATCSILEEAECGPTTPGPLAACLDACSQTQEPFICASEGRAIDASWVCDGRNDCLDSSDEADCALASFECAAEQQVIGAVRCDGLEQCEDGSDEADCVLFDCLSSGDSIPEELFCDGHEHCLDGSDEHGCARLRCGNASRASRTPDDTSQYENTCAGLQKKLENCALVAAGDYPCVEPQQPDEQCIHQCRLHASCGMLESALCGGSVAPPLQRCMQDCLARDPFMCPDSTTEIQRNLVCNGQVNCPGGSDEMDCPVPETFSCAADGSEIALASKCNGRVDCPDGSDEQGCPMFECELTGVTVPARFVCDAEEDCLDGSDEAGCGKLICPE